MNTEALFKIGWELTKQLGYNAVTWKVGEDGDLEVWSDERYFVVTMPEPETFIVTEEEEDDFDVLRDRKVWHEWSDAAHDVLDRIKGPQHE
jgi:hypothetical protein